MNRRKGIAVISKDKEKLKGLQKELLDLGIVWQSSNNTVLDINPKREAMVISDWGYSADDIMLSLVSVNLLKEAQKDLGIDKIYTVDQRDDIISKAKEMKNNK